MNGQTRPGTAAMASAAPGAPRIQLLGSFGVWDRGRPLRVPRDAQRLLAFLALRRQRLPRAFVAGTVWVESSQTKAFGSLRSALWRLGNQAETLVDADSDSVALSPEVATDVEESSIAASRLCDRADSCKEERFTIDAFAHELLPGWYDEWVVFERERFRQQSLHALEALACRLADEKDYAAAIEAALAAIALDPLRESAHRCLVAVHLEEGNHSEALRHFEIFATRLHTQLGLDPSQQMIDLIAGIS